MMKVQKLIGVGSLTLLLLGACGGSSDGGSAPTPIPREQAPEQFISAVCDNIAPCCAKSGLSYDNAGCRKTWDTIVNGFLFGYPNTTSYDGAAAASCLALVKQAYATCSDVPTDGVCQRVVAGNVPVGGACTDSIECVAPPGGDASCDNEQCKQEPRGKSGDACSSTCTQSPGHVSCFGGSGTASGNAVCYTNDGLACANDGKCAPLAALGQPCTFGGCVEGAFCESGTCATKKAVGSPCSDYDTCVPTAFCDFQGSNNCEAKKASGAACQDSDECTDGDCNENKCGSEGIANPSSCSGMQPIP